jgi:cytochrome c oxidase subunit 2
MSSPLGAVSYVFAALVERMRPALMAGLAVGLTGYSGLIRQFRAWAGPPGPAWMPPNGALHGFALDHLMKINLLLICGALLISHFVLIVAMFRRRGGRTWPGILVIESMTLVLIMLVFVWMTVSSQALWARSRFEGASPQAMQVEVVGAQFQWYFRYPGEDATFGKTQPELVDPAAGNPLGIDPKDPDGKDDMVSSQLVLPVGREVDIQLRSQDVIHGFSVSGMRVKQDAVPGMVLHIHFTPVRQGDYPILCTQLCGLGHGRMQAELHVVSTTEYAAWLSGRQKAPLAEGGAE